MKPRLKQTLLKPIYIFKSEKKLNSKIKRLIKWISWFSVPHFKQSHGCVPKSFKVWLFVRIYEHKKHIYVVKSYEKRIWKMHGKMPSAYWLKVTNWNVSIHLTKRLIEGSLEIKFKHFNFPRKVLVRADEVINICSHERNFITLHFLLFRL